MPRSLLLALAFALPLGAAHAQPTNDIRTAAYSIVQASTYTGTNVGATSGGGSFQTETRASCAFQNADGINSVWWWFVPTGNGDVTIDLSGSTFDTVLSVQDAAGTELSCNDDLDQNTLQSRTTVSVTQGEIYYVRVVGWNGAEGDIAMAVSNTAILTRPPHDGINNAPVTLVDGVYDSSIVGATRAASFDPSATCVPSSADGGNSVWRVINEPSAGSIGISLAGSNFNNVISVLRLDPGSVLTEVACNANGSASAVGFSIEANRSYVVRVVGFNGASGDRLRMTVSGLGAVVDAEDGPEAAFELGAPAPNPVSGRSTIPFRLDAPADVRLEVLDALGRVVATPAEGAYAAGSHRVTWNAAGQAAGLYIVRLTRGGRSTARMLSVVR